MSMSISSINSLSSRPVVHVGENLRSQDCANDWNSNVDDVEACRSETNANNHNLSSTADYSGYPHGQYLDDQLIDKSIEEVRGRRHVDSEIFPLKGNGTSDLNGENPDSKSECGETLISRQWYKVLPSSLVLFIILQCVITGSATVCNVVEPFAPWTHTSAVAVLACYGLSVTYYIANGFSVDCWAQRECQHLRGVYASAATICVVACASTALFTTPLGEEYFYSQCVLQAKNRILKEMK